MARIDAYGMPSEELIHSIEALVGAGDHEIIVTTDSKQTLEELTAYSNDSESEFEVHDIDKGWEVHIYIGDVKNVTLPHSNESSVPEDAV